MSSPIHQNVAPGEAGSAESAARAAGGLRPALGALVLFAALAAFHTWPLASAPGTWSRNDNGDALIDQWTIAWVAHQLPRDPLHLFDANIFYPERRTLAFSEHLVPQALMVAPVLWMGGSPVLAFNLCLLAGFTLTAWAMCLVIRRWTGNWWAALIAGCLAGYNASSLTRLTHIQSQHLEFLPLAILALDRLLDSPRTRHALALGGWFGLQALTSVYLLVFSSVAMVAAAAVRPLEWSGARFRQIAPRLLLAASIAIVLLLPFLAVYWRVHEEHGVARTLSDLRLYSASWRDYLATGGMLHWPWSRAFWRGNGFFPGVTATALVVAAIGSGVAFRDRRARMWLAIGVVGFCFSFGASFAPYVWLHQVVPLFQSIRAVNRYGQLVLLSVAVLGGFGAAWSLGRLRAGTRRSAIGLLLLVLVNAEAWRGPLSLTKFEGIPKEFATLASVPGAVVVCFPFYSFGTEIGGNGRHMLNSTANWRPLLNGYSGFAPRSFQRHVAGVSRFPDEASVAYLRSVGVTHVVIDTELFAPQRTEAAAHTDALRPWLTDGRYRIYELR